MKKSTLPISIPISLVLVALTVVILWRNPQPLSQFQNPSPSADSPPSLSASQQRDSSSADGSLIMRQLTTEQAVKLSVRIVLVRCRSVNVREIPRAGIFTISDFEVLQTIKGTLRKDHFTLSLIGGRLGDRQTSGPFDGVEFSQGKKYILFLGRDARDGEPTINPRHRFEVKTNPLDKTEVIIPVPTDLPLFHSKDGQLYTSPPTVLPMEDFLFSLGKLN